MPGQAEVVLSLDISSSGVRARAHDLAMVTRAEAEVGLETTIDEAGRATHDLGAVMAGVAHVLRAVAAQPGLRPVALVGSGTGSSVATRARGQTSDVYLWSDRQAAASWSLVAGASAAAFGRTLCPPHVSYWPAKLAWLGQSGRARPGARFGGEKDWVFEWLTGCFWTDPMSAGATGVFDSESWQWDQPLLAHLGVGVDHLPEVRAATDSAPMLAAAAEQLGLPGGLAVVVGGMDGVLAHLGSTGLAVGEASCTVGTSIAFRASSPARRVDPAARVWCYPVDRSHWVVGAAGNNGGNVLTWAGDRFSPGVGLAELLDRAFDARPDPTLQFVPYLFGERAPLWRPELRAALVGLDAHHTVADIVRAALEGTACSLVELADAVRAVAGDQPHARLTGGFLREPRWSQLMVDALGVAASVPVPESATASGAAVLGWAASGAGAVEGWFQPGRAEPRVADASRHAGLVAGAARLRATRDALWPEAGG